MIGSGSSPLKRTATEPVAGGVWLVFCLPRKDFLCLMAQRIGDAWGWCLCLMVEMRSKLDMWIGLDDKTKHNRLDLEKLLGQLPGYPGLDCFRLSFR